MSALKDLANLAFKSVVTLARNMGLENPALYQWLGEGRHTAAGKNVNVDTAMQLSAVWACVRLIAQTISTLPLHVYERVDENKKARAYSHPLYVLLHDSPNADMTSVEFWEAMVANLLLWGNAYAEKEMIVGRVVALTPLPASAVQPRRERDGRIVYRLTVNGKVRDIPEGNMMHIKGFTLDGLMGISPIMQAAQSLGIAIAAEEAAGSLFANGMRIGGVLTAPSYLTGPQRAEAKTMLAAYQSAVNSGKTPVLEGGWKFEAVTMPPQDAQLLATREFGIEEICRWYQVAPMMIGHVQKTTTWGTGLEQMNLGFLTYTLAPILRRIEQTVRKSLIPAGERSRIFAEFALEGLLRADSAGRAALFTAQVQNGLKTRNEVRALENDEALEGGDMLTVQSNLVPLDMLQKLAEKAAEPPPKPQPPQNQPRQDQGAGTQGAIRQ